MKAHKTRYLCLVVIVIIMLSSGTSFRVNVEPYKDTGVVYEPFIPPFEEEFNYVEYETIIKVKEPVASRNEDRGVKPISYDMNLLSYSGLNALELNNVLDDTSLKGLAEFYIQAENNTGVNALFLVALSAHESAWGKSSLAVNKNNLYGFCAYDDNVSKASFFDSKGECILFVASYLKEHYLTEGGDYYNGYNLSSINIMYASDNNWSKKVFNTMQYILNKVRGD